MLTRANGVGHLAKPIGGRLFVEEKCLVWRQSVAVVDAILQRL